MSITLRFDITARSEEEGNVIQAVDNAHDRSFYTNDLTLTTAAEGFVLITPNGKIALENDDQIITEHFIYQVKLGVTQDQAIQFNSTRAPTQTLSEQWQQVGLDGLLLSGEKPSDALPTRQPTERHDPLAFLNPTTAPAVTTAPQLNEVAGSLPTLSQHLTLSKVSPKAALSSASQHLNHEQPSNPFHNSSLLPDANNVFANPAEINRPESVLHRNPSDHNITPHNPNPRQESRDKNTIKSWFKRHKLH